MQPIMQPETVGFDKWSTRRAALRMGFGLWVAGFVVAGAAAWQMHHASSARDEATQTETSARIRATPGARCEVATKDGQATDVAENASVIHAPESEGAMVMPEDTIVGRRKSDMGATQMQKASGNSVYPRLATTQKYPLVVER
jgi:hypothetical protein